MGRARARSLTDKAPGFEPGEWGFDSLRARQRASHRRNAERAQGLFDRRQDLNRGVELHDMQNRPDERALRDDQAQTLAALPQTTLKIEEQVQTPPGEGANTG